MFPELGNPKNPYRLFSTAELFPLEKKLRFVFEEHPVLHSIQILKTETTTVSDELREIAEGEPYYLLRQVPLRLLLEYEFLEAFVRSKECGKLSIISAYSQQRKNSMSITPKGILSITLDREESHKFGIDSSFGGHSERIRNFDPEIRKIKVYLKNEKFHPGSGQYDRLIAAVERCDYKYDILLSYEPPNADISPVSPVLYLEKKIENLDWKKCQNSYSYRQLFNTNIPLATEQVQFYDWLNIVLSGGDPPAAVDCPTNEVNVLVAQWTGFLTKSHVRRFYRQLTSEGAFIMNLIRFRSDPITRPNSAFNGESMTSIQSSSTMNAVIEHPPFDGEYQQAFFNYV